MQKIILYLLLIIFGFILLYMGQNIGIINIKYNDEFEFDKSIYGEIGVKINNNYIKIFGLNNNDFDIIYKNDFVKYNIDKKAIKAIKVDNDGVRNVFYTIKDKKVDLNNNNKSIYNIYHNSFYTDNISYNFQLLKTIDLSENDNKIKIKY